MPGRGYALVDPLDLLDATAIRTRLSPEAREALAGLEVAWSIDSTNSELLRRSTNVRKADVLLAERQTGGRGRLRAHLGLAAGGAPVPVASRAHFGGGLARLGGL